jgi:hypothetical protein
MLSPKFIQLIESHSGEIASAVLQELSRDPKTPRLGRLPRSEFEDRFQDIARNLGNWLADAREDQIAHRFAGIGRSLGDPGIAPSEIVHALHALKERMLDTIRNQGWAQTSLDLYAEEELEHQVGRFFDTAVYHVVRGCETAVQPMAAGARPG